ncbi:transporter substrate-binding domain-containing protein [Aestuariirhabdus sp. LZHN29]|uniref:transporter substrate-binding domain-containing protein n=1 Tax=Aestuariirhabdus sp. LZHN29 TaxID=3417462 RepID=UPI003CF7B631
MKSLLATTFLLLLLCPSAPAAEVVRCGIATGFPPYQYEARGRPAGLDLKVIEAVGRKMGRTIEIVQHPWDQLLRLLETGEIECVAGMEVSTERARYALFSTPYYARQAVIFVRADNTTVVDEQSLEWSMVTGDRDSTIERRIAHNRIPGSYRFYPAASKLEAMELLREREVIASIMPREVGFYLAKRLGFEVRVVGRPGKRAPVVIAVARAYPQLHQQVQRALANLIETGAIGPLLQMDDSH